MKKYGKKGGYNNHIMFQKVVGFLVLGVAGTILSKYFFEVQNFGLAFTSPKATTLWSLVLCSLFVLINIYVAKRPENLSVYPQIRTNNWTYPLLIKYIGSWIIFLFAYELLFRGIFLNILLQETNVATAIAINTVIYSLAHFHKGKREVLGSIPFGILLCYSTVATGNIWTAFLLHTTQAVANNLLSLRYHPNMQLISRK